jgi:FAD:protein FMN transferase
MGPVKALREFRFGLTQPGWNRYSFEPVLGTRFTLQVRSAKRRVADQVATKLQAEIERLENLLSIYRPQSALSLWRAPEWTGKLLSSDSPELTEVLALAELWRQRTNGCFHAMAGVLTNRWQHAQATQVLPNPGELEALRVSLLQPWYTVDSSTGDITKIGDCSALSLHAIAKGWIVDSAAELAMRDARVSAVLVNIGGDLRLCGNEAEAASTVAIENPLRAYDNEPPACRIRLLAGGLATSGGSRRGFTIDNQWFSHVIDPRTGYPVDRIASASVFAPDTTTADAIATMLSVVDPVEGLAFLQNLEDEGTFPAGSLGCLIIDPTGRQFSNGAWNQQVV